MSFRWVENELQLDFGDGWGPILCWDKHRAYTNGICEVDKGGAVDVVGLHGRTLYLIEVKDYRFHERTNPVHPVLQLEHKVRNTVAGLLGACRREEYTGDCAPIVQLIRDPAIEIKIVFWYETRHAGGVREEAGRKRAKVGSLLAARRVKNNVKWLAAGVFSTSKVEEYPEIVPDLVVTSLPQRRRALAERVLNTLRRRGVELGEEDRVRIQGCLDVARLERWDARSEHVTSAEDLWGPGG